MEYDPCADVERAVGQQTFDVALSLTATGPETTTWSREVTRDPDGNRVTLTYRATDRTAAGSVTLDGVARSVDGVLTKQVWHTRIAGK